MIQGCQAPQTPTLQILPAPPAAATLEQLGKSFMFETSDHLATVT
jgi:hypothetical protein